MTRSYDLKRHPDADYTPSDIEPPERSNPIEAWSDFDDQETNRLIENEKEYLANQIPL